MAKWRVLIGVGPSILACFQRVAATVIYVLTRGGLVLEELSVRIGSPGTGATASETMIETVAR